VIAKYPINITNQMSGSGRDVLASVANFFKIKHSRFISKRVIAPSYQHHITQRGNCRQQIFFYEDDYKTYYQKSTRRRWKSSANMKEVKDLWETKNLSKSLKEL
jgi:hypothetical protein